MDTLEAGRAKKRSPAKRTPKRKSPAKRTPKRKSPAKRTPKRSPKRKTQRKTVRKTFAKRTKPGRKPTRFVERVPERVPEPAFDPNERSCQTLFTKITKKPAGSPINLQDVLSTYEVTGANSFKAKYPGPVKVQGRTFQIDTDKNPINCGSYGCGYVSSRNDLGFTVLVKVLKVCPEVPQPDPTRFPVNFEQELKLQEKAASLGVAPKIYAYDLKEGSVVMEYLNPSDYESFGKLRYGFQSKGCKYLEEYQEIALFEALYKLSKAQIGYYDSNPANFMIPKRQGLPAKIIDQGLIKFSFNPLDILISDTIIVPRVQQYLYKYAPQTLFRNDFYIGALYDFEGIRAQSVHDVFEHHPAIRKCGDLLTASFVQKMNDLLA